jgi:ABC-type nitrate/sulfonate/bicarbonate transport system substrate-binding protein
MAAVVSGSVDATVITSPAEYAAEKQGLRVIMSAQELGHLVRIPITGIGATQKKMEKDPDEIVRVLRALRLSTLYLLQNPEYSHALFQRIMHVDALAADKCSSSTAINTIPICRFPIQSSKICWRWARSG